MKALFTPVAIVAALPLMAQETRQLDAHEHGVGQLDIAMEGSQVAMVLHAPGADIVGFEYEAETDADQAAVDAALAVLAQPQELFVLPASAGCSVTQAVAELEAEAEHEEHEEHEEDHAEEGHSDHEEGAHADEPRHTEFHAEYLLDCTDPAALTTITFAYFDAFPNALEVEVQLITDAGATSFEVERAAPMLDLSEAF